MISDEKSINLIYEVFLENNNDYIKWCIENKSLFDLSDVQIQFLIKNLMELEESFN